MVFTSDQPSNYSFYLHSSLKQRVQQKYSPQKQSPEPLIDDSGQQLVFLQCPGEIASPTVHHQLKIRNCHQPAKEIDFFFACVIKLQGCSNLFLKLNNKHQQKSEEKLGGEGIQPLWFLQKAHGTWENNQHVTLISTIHTLITILKPQELPSENSR